MRTTVPTNPTYTLVSYSKTSEGLLPVDAYIAVVRSLFGEFTKHTVMGWILLRVVRLFVVLILMLHV